MNLTETISALLKETPTEEIMYDGPGKKLKIYQRGKGIIDTDYVFDEKEALAFIDAVCRANNKVLDKKNPILDGSLPDGSRINVTVPPASKTILITIRRFGEVRTIVDLIRDKVISAEAAAFVWTAVEGFGSMPSNILIIGGTSSGKTTFLNALSMFIEEKARIITIEDTSEIKLIHENWVQLIASELSMEELLKNTLRMRPDRIFVGEVRGKEAATMFEAMNTGHNGFLGTLHANTAKDCIGKLENPPFDISPQLLGNLNLIITLKKTNYDRKVVEITETIGNSEQISFNTIFTLDAKKNSLVNTKIPSRLRSNLANNSNIKVAQFDRIQAERKKMLESLLRYEIALSPKRLLEMLTACAVESMRKKKGLFNF